MSKSTVSFLLVFLIGLLIFRFFTFYHDKPQFHDGEQVSVTAQLQEEPAIAAGGQSFSLKTAYNDTIFIKTKTFSQYSYGQTLAVSGRLKVTKSGNHQTLSMTYPKILVVKNDNNPVDQLAAVVRQKSKQLYTGTLPPVSASLLAGIVFGSKEQFPKTFKDDLRSVGVLHVIAASGMNVTFVAAAIMYTLGLFLRRQFALAVGILAISFYTVIVGFQPSIVRAAIMAILGFSAALFGRQYLSVFTILLTAYVMLLWQPAFLTDVGFQLSFLSTLGILLIQPLIPAKKLFLTEDVATTTAAQIATLPVMLGVFGSYGLLSILVNALVLWTVPLLMTLGAAAVLVGFVFVPLAQLLLFLCLPFLLFFEKTVSFFGSLGWNFQLSTFPVALVVGYYFILLSMILFFRKRREPEK